MSSDFWSRNLGGQPAPPTPQAPPSRAPRAWWQDPEPEPQYAPPQQYQQAPQQYAQQQPANYGALQQQMPYSGQQAGAGMPEDQYIKQLLRIPSPELNQEQMEQIAEWELRTKAKYNNPCPQCDSPNYVPAGAKHHGVTFPTEKCFDCGLSARGPEPALGGTGGTPGASTRQIDAGGAVKSMYLSSRHLPHLYQPRGS